MFRILFSRVPGPRAGRAAFAASRMTGVLMGGLLLTGLLMGSALIQPGPAEAGVAGTGSGPILLAQAADSQAGADEPVASETSDSDSGQTAGGLVNTGEPLVFCLALPGWTAAGLAQVVEALAAYLEGVLARPVRGRLLAGPGEAPAWIEEHQPDFGLVQAPFYVQHARKLAMTPLAASRPGGFETDQWRLMVRPEDKDKPLSGLLRGSMFFSSRAAACMLLAGTSGGMVRLEGAAHPLEALRELLAGQGQAVALDRLQYEAVHGLPEFRDLAEIHATAELPMPPLVWFGPLPEERAGHASEAVARAFQAMADDPKALTVLRALGIQGFGPPDPSLAKLLKSCRE